MRMNVCVYVQKTPKLHGFLHRTLLLFRGGNSLTTNVFLLSSFTILNPWFRFCLFIIFEMFAFSMPLSEFYSIFYSTSFGFWTPTIRFFSVLFTLSIVFYARLSLGVRFFNCYYSIVYALLFIAILLLHFCFNRNTKSLEFTSAYTLSTHPFSQHHTRGVQMYTAISRELKNTHKHKHTHAYMHTLCERAREDWSPFAAISTHTSEHTRIRTIRLIFRCLPNETRRST